MPQFIITLPLGFLWSIPLMYIQWVLISRSLIQALHLFCQKNLHVWGISLLKELKFSFFNSVSYLFASFFCCIINYLCKQALVLKWLFIFILLNWNFSFHFYCLWDRIQNDMGRNVFWFKNWVEIVHEMYVEKKNYWTSMHTSNKCF